MRQLLDRFFSATGYLAGLFMVGTLLSVLASILGRLHPVFDLPGADAYAGYCMAISAFLALAPTLRRGEHIRVTLILSALSGRWKKGMEVWALTFASALSCLFAFYSCRLSWQSRMFNDISTGSDATPLWIPQIGMAVGTVILAIAFVDELVLELRGQRVTLSSDEPLRNE